MANFKAPMKINRKFSSLLKTCLAIITVVLQLGCPSQPQPKECVEFFNTDARQDERIFAGYDLERQLTIHRCGLDRHPPSDYSYRIADRGKTIIPVLLEKLNSNDGNDYKGKYYADKTKYGIILIFRRLAKDGELKNNKEVIEVLDKTVSEIGRGWIRDEAEESLTEIKRNSN
jgi:hypothetical protein